MENFTPVSATLGGALIGLAASLLLLTQGRVAGISGILAGAITPRSGEVGWRLTFIGGLLAGGLVLMLVWPASITASPVSLPLVALAGLGMPPAATACKGGIA